MVRILAQSFPLTLEGVAVDGSYVIDAAGLSTDAKPSDSTISTGSTFVEVDTGSVFFYDEISRHWLKVGGNG